MLSLATWKASWRVNPMTAALAAAYCGPPSWLWLSAGDRRRIDDPTPTSRAQGRRAAPAAVKHAFDVEIHRSIPVGEVKVLDRARAADAVSARSADSIDERVQSSISLDRGGNHFEHLIVVEYVDLHPDRVLANVQFSGGAPCSSPSRSARTIRAPAGARYLAVARPRPSARSGNQDNFSSGERQHRSSIRSSPGIVRPARSGVKHGQPALAEPSPSSRGALGLEHY